MSLPPMMAVEHGAAGCVLEAGKIAPHSKDPLLALFSACSSAAVCSPPCTSAPAASHKQVIVRAATSADQGNQIGVSLNLHPDGCKKR